MVAVEPALTVAAKSTVSTTKFETAWQGPNGSSVVSVKVTVPLFVAMGVNKTLDGVAVAPKLLN